MTQSRLGKIPTKYRRDVQIKLRVIANAVQSKRKKLGLSQERLAEILDIAPTTLQFIEQHRRFPSLPMLVYLCQVLKLDIDLSDVR